MAQPQETYWLWVGGALTTLGAALIGVSSAIVPACAVFCAAVLCVVAARSGARFPSFKRKKPGRRRIRHDWNPDDLVMATEAPQEASSESHSANVSDEVELRAYVDESPRRLCRIARSLTSVQKQQVRHLYYGRWFRVEGPVQDVGSWGRSYSQVIMKRELRGPAVELRFTSQWIFDNQLAVLSKGRQIKAVGRIVEITDASITLTDCELETASRS